LETHIGFQALIAASATPSGDVQAFPDADKTQHDPKTAHPPQQMGSEQTSADVLYHHVLQA
jgi:hypothetical protein